MRKISLVAVLLAILVLAVVVLALSVSSVKADNTEIIPIDHILPGQCVGVPGHQICIVFLNIVQNHAIGFDNFGTAGYCIPTRDDPFRCSP